MTQYVIDCGQVGSNTTCTMVPYSAPPATVDHYSLGPTWDVPVIAGLFLAVIIGTAVVRYRAHVEHGNVERARIMNPPKQCPTCGDKV